MSSTIKSLRRVGIVGLSTVVAASMMTFSGATSFAAAGDYVAVTAPNVSPGTTNQAAGNVTLDFANSFVFGSQQTFQIKPGGVANDCTTPAGLAKAVSFNADPVPVSPADGPFLADGVTPGDGTDTKPTLAGVAVTGSTSLCTANGVNDVFAVKITLVGGSTGVATDTFRMTLGTVSYDLGAKAALGNVNLVTSGALVTGPASVVNALVAGATHTSPGLALVVPGTTGNAIGTQTLAESAPGAFFGAGGTTTPVKLTLSGGTNFTGGVTPTITLPAGYTTPSLPATTAVSTYTFTVKSAGTPVAATMTIAGLTVTAAGSATDVTLAISGGVNDPAPLTAIRNILYTARTGGAGRYDTAAALFNSTFSGSTSAVLASGMDFPDALSANYLAGQLTTGTLLTTPDTLATAARNAIISSSNSIATVYIIGGTAAVSQAVQDELEALHPQNNPNNGFINVVRIAGAGRYETNVAVNEFTFFPKTTVLLASGANFPDALALGPVAYQQQYPLILTGGTTLGATENQQLSDFHPTNVVIAGGTNVVSQAIEDSLTAQGYTVLRLKGDGRTQTAAAIASWATDGVGTKTGIRHDQGFNSSVTYVATGAGFADALAAGPVAGKVSTPIVLTDSATSLGLGIPSYLGSKLVGTSSTTVGTLHALGLTSALSTAVMRAAALTVGQ